MQRSLQIHEAVLISLKDQYSAEFGNLSVPKIKIKNVFECGNVPILYERPTCLFSYNQGDI